MRSTPTSIYARMSGYGHSGPHADYRSYGPVVQAVSGLSHISGLPGQRAVGLGPVVHGQPGRVLQRRRHCSLALYARDAPASGTDVDVSAVEAGVELLGPLLLDVAVNGRTTRGDDFPTGNRLEHPAAAPHGVYPCRGRRPLGGHRRVRRRRVGGARRRARATRRGRTTRGSRRRRPAPPHQDDLDAHIAAWTGAAGPARGDAPAAGRRRARRRGAGRRGRQRARPADGAPRDRSSSSTTRSSARPASRACRSRRRSFAPDHWRSAPLLGEDNALRVRRAPRASTTTRSTSWPTRGDLSVRTERDRRPRPVRRPARRRAGRRPGRRADRRCSSPTSAPTSSRSSRPTAPRRVTSGRSSATSPTPSAASPTGTTTAASAASCSTSTADEGRARSTRSSPAPTCSSARCTRSSCAGSGIDLARARARPAPSLIVVSITPFGLTGRGPTTGRRDLVGAGRQRAADHVRLRRPLDPADPPRRRPGVPHGRQLRPHRRAAGAASSASAPARAAASTWRCRRRPASPSSWPTRTGSTRGRWSSGRPAGTPSPCRPSRRSSGAPTGGGSTSP